MEVSKVGFILVGKVRARFHGLKISYLSPKFSFKRPQSVNAPVPDISFDVVKDRGKGR